MGKTVAYFLQVFVVHALLNGDVEEVNMEDNARNAKSAEALLFVNMGESALLAKSAEALLFLNMGDAEAVLFVNMGEYALNAKNAEALLFVNMGDYALDAKSVEALLFVSNNHHSVLSHYHHLQSQVTGPPLKNERTTVSGPLQTKRVSGTMHRSIRKMLMRKTQKYGLKDTRLLQKIN